MASRNAKSLNPGSRRLIEVDRHLVKTVTGGTTLNQRYDVFGRATTSDVGAQVVEQNAYDGYDRLVRQQKFDTAGTPTFTRNQVYDPFDRVTSQSEKVGTAASVTTRYTFVGLANQVAIEEEKDTSGAWKTSKSYSYGANGENLSLVDSPVNGTTSKKSFYGTNPHGDVETLTDATGSTTSTYRYTAYGQPDKKGTTGDDVIWDDATKDADIVNPYRFNSARFDGAAGTYDMGFREYNPSLNRFLTRDMFNGALQDLSLGTDPWNANRYMFGGGNPISRIELNGHMNATESSGGGGVIGYDLELCGSDCSVDATNGLKIVDPTPAGPTGFDNFMAGSMQGFIETGEQLPAANLINTARNLAGIGTDSQIYRGMVEKYGVADTNSGTYEAGRIVGPMAIPVGGIEAGTARAADRAAISITEKAVAKAADDAEVTATLESRVAEVHGALDPIAQTKANDCWIGD